jgi:hypothetical protein
MVSIYLFLKRIMSLLLLIENLVQFNSIKQNNGNYIYIYIEVDLIKNELN